MRSQRTLMPNVVVPASINDRPGRVNPGSSGGRPRSLEAKKEKLRGWQILLRLARLRDVR